jgi:hypothetical protein
MTKKTRTDGRATATDMLLDIHPILMTAYGWNSTNPEHRAAMVIRNGIEQIESAAKLLTNETCLPSHPELSPLTFVVTGLEEQARQMRRALGVLRPVAVY